MVVHEKEDEKEVGNGMHIKLKVNIVKGGQVQSAYRIWSNNDVLGFTGGFSAFFFDSEDRVFDMTKWRTYGVNARPFPGHEKEGTEIDELGEDVFTATERIDIFLVHEADVRWENIERAIEAGKGIAEILEAFRG